MNVDLGFFTRGSMTQPQAVPQPDMVPRHNNGIDRVLNWIKLVVCRLPKCQRYLFKTYFCCISKAEKGSWLAETVGTRY